MRDIETLLRIANSLGRYTITKSEWALLRGQVVTVSETASTINKRGRDMSREDVIRMAREAGAIDQMIVDKFFLERFYDAAFRAGAEAEREACIKALEENEQFYCRDTIRARGEK